MAAPPFDIDAFGRRLADAVSGAWTAVIAPARDPALDADIAAKAAQAAPVVWLIGKVQSGKSSIVRALTGATAAEVGAGFKACTETARVFDFPADAPVIRFLDTRGVGEAGYDATADIGFAESQAHLLLVVMKAIDPAQDEILRIVRQARASHPHWPLLVAQTSLHEAYAPGATHPAPYAFDAAGRPTAALPGDLDRALAYQRGRFDAMPGQGPVRFVPIDFTQDGDGFEPRLYGLDALLEGLAAVAPAAVSAVLAGGHDGAGDARGRRAQSHIMGYAAAAAAADVIPVAGAVAVPGIQGKLLHSLGEIYGVAWDRRMAGEFAAALGAGVLARMASTFGARQLAKLIPVYGQTAGAAAAAAMSFATTYALGTAAGYYLGRRRLGMTGTEGVLETYQQALRQAFSMRRPGDGPVDDAKPGKSGDAGS